MFDMGITELLLIGIVALVIIGPERLPGVARTAGKYVGKFRRFMVNVRADVESELKTDELREILAKQQEELRSLKDVVNDVGKDLDMSDLKESVSDLEATLKSEPEVTKPELETIDAPLKNWTEELKAPESPTGDDHTDMSDEPYEPTVPEPDLESKKTPV